MRFIPTVFAALLVCGLSSTEVLAQKKKVEILKKWSGSVTDEAIAKTTPPPEVITSAKQLEGIWKAWKVPMELPAVDFKTSLIVVVHSPGSRLDLVSAVLDEKGNLEPLGLGTRDFGPGFRFVLGVVSREGVVTVNGKKLPTD